MKKRRKQEETNMNDMILKADRVLLGEDLIPKENMAVIVREGKIEDILSQAECPGNPGCKGNRV